MKKAIVSVFARDARGITAYVTALLAQQEINILDISQTLMQEYFAMIMLVDLEACPLPFHELAEWLQEKGAERALDIHIQREEIFEAMHRI
ncbi:MAG: ACT domain-containing protein [Oscillospiraceae bacterium]|nr:ACT domain-containing protein [Oscillospiraceae bacterium]